MFGLFFEDINYSLDGGLYAEMLENRHFEFLEGRGRKTQYYQVPAYRYGWNPYPLNSNTNLDIREDFPLNETNPHYLRATVCRVGEGFTNKAYDGIFMKPDVGCRVSFYAKGTGTVQIQVLDKGGRVLVASEELRISENGKDAKGSGNGWCKYETRLVSDEEICGGIFAVIFTQIGTVSFDQFSMMPEDAVYGIFRKDLAELLKALEPGFLRFPGGCIVEGNELANRYQWKLTLGPVEERKANWNRWAVHDNDLSEIDLSPWPYYNQTLGVGYYEYFLLCEYLECKPLPVMNVGLACQYQSEELVRSDTAEFQEFVQDALDLIEFANGPADSEWGAVRARMGHPEPFGMELIGIGNEQWETEQVDFFHRYECFEKAIHDKYPEIKCIGSAGPDVRREEYRKAWEHYSPVMKERPEYAYAVDEHYYVPDNWLYEHVHFYDDYPRQNKVFAGEYACHIKPDAPPVERNCFASALAEAAFMVGLERNADVVLMASYAPLLARVDYAQWQPDLIWFDAKQSYATPNYYVQQIYSCYTGDTLLRISGEQDAEARKVYATASRDSESGKTYIKIINAGDTAQTIELSYPGGKLAAATLVTMSGGPDDFNSIAEPYKVAPSASPIDAAEPVTVSAHTIAVVIV